MYRPSEDGHPAWIVSTVDHQWLQRADEWLRDARQQILRRLQDLLALAADEAALDPLTRATRDTYSELQVSSGWQDLDDLREQLHQLFHGAIDHENVDNDSVRQQLLRDYKQWVHDFCDLVKRLIDLPHT